MTAPGLNNTAIQLETEGSMVMIDSNNDPVQAGFILLPVAGSGS